MITKGYVIAERRVNEVFLQYRELKARKDAVGKKLSQEKDAQKLVDLLTVYNDLLEKTMFLLDIIGVLGLAFDLDKEIYTDLPAEHEIFGVRTVEILKEA